MVSITGKVIYKEFLKENFKQIDLSNYSKGIYFIKATNEKETFVEKIVVE